MNNKRLTHNATVATLFLLVLAVSGPARGDRPLSHAMPALNPAMPGLQKIAPVNDPFAALDLSDAQKAEVQKIRQNAEERKAAVVRAQNIGPDQKDAMILGYTRAEYSQIFRVLTPAQQKVVRERIRTQQVEAAKQKDRAN